MSALSSGERLGELATSNHSVTLVLVLFTFCPPGPLLCDAVKTSSSSGMQISLLIVSIVRHLIVRLTVLDSSVFTHPVKT